MARLTASSLDESDIVVPRLVRSVLERVPVEEGQGVVGVRERHAGGPAPTLDAGEQLAVGEGDAGTGEGHPGRGRRRPVLEPVTHPAEVRSGHGPTVAVKAQTGHGLR